MPSVVPDVAIVSYNTADYLLNLLESLAPLAASGSIQRVHVWDNASCDSTADLLRRYGARHAWLTARLSSTNAHHGPALDALLRTRCQAEWALILDADTEVRAPFSAAIDRLDLQDVAFVGQIHPQMNQLYAYLAHLLVHRPRYLELPRFRQDGAPGIDYFAAIDRARQPYRRFRWVDFIRHFGQSSLRRVVARGERSNEFYAFARAETEKKPLSPARQRHEDTLGARLRTYLAAPAGDTGPADVATTDGRDASRGAAPVADRGWAYEASVWFRAPLRARALQEARRLGLRLRASEAERLLAIVERERPRRVLEIGTGHGGTFLLWAHAAAADATLVSVDWPLWEMDDPAEEATLAKIARVRRRAQSVHLLRGQASHPDVFHQARAYFGTQPVDFLFLSSNGPGAGVAAAAAGYIDAVRDGGIIAVADIHPHPRGWDGELRPLWQELRQRGRPIEIVGDPAQHGGGVGVLWKGPR
jgi:predicted O-methyltransferase YrrM